MSQKVQSTQTGEVKVVDEATQDMSDTGGWVPVGADTPVTLVPSTGNTGTQVDVSSTPGGIDDTFSEFNSAMSAKELSLAEKKQEEERMIREQADATFNPLIDDARITGEKREGGGRMALGSTRGLGLSTAGSSYIAHIEQQTDKAVADLETQKAAFISSGNFQAADRAEERLDKFRGQQLEMIGLKNQMAQQVFMNELAEAGLDLQKESMSLAKQESLFNQVVTKAGLTGEFEGTQTFQAKQATIQNKLAMAQLTGVLDGEATLGGQDFALKQQQVKAELAQIPFQNQLALYQVLSSIPSNRSLELDIPGVGKKTFSGMKAVETSTGVGANGIGEITDAIRGYADLVEKDPNYLDTIKDQATRNAVMAEVYSRKTGNNVNEELAKQQLIREANLKIGMGKDPYNELEEIASGTGDYAELTIEERNELWNDMKDIIEAKEKETAKDSGSLIKFYTSGGFADSSKFLYDVFINDPIETLYNSIIK